jgi:hypothetical protein
MKIRTVLSATTVAALAVLGTAATANASGTVDRHVDTRASYYGIAPSSTMVNSWHGHPVVYVDGSSGAYGYMTCSGGIASPIYVTVYAVRDGISLNVVKHEFTHVLECWNGDYSNASYTKDANFLEDVAAAGQMLQGGSDVYTERSRVWFHAQYLLQKFLITG